MPDRHDFGEYRPQNDHDLLVMLLAQTRHINDGIREIRVILGDTQKQLGALSLASDRHDRRIAHLEQDAAERIAQGDTMILRMQKIEGDLLGRIERLETECIDPLSDKVKNLNARIAGAVAVLAFLWLFAAPFWARLVAGWLGG